MHTHMKNFLTVLVGIFFLLGTESLTAQNPVGTQYKPNLDNFEKLAKEALGEEYFEAMNEQWKETYKDLFQNRLVISKLSEQPQTYNSLEDFPVYNKNIIHEENFNPEKFNPFNYKLDYFNTEEDVYYKIYNTEYFLLIKRKESDVAN